MKFLLALTKDVSQKFVVGWFLLNEKTKIFAPKRDLQKVPKSRKLLKHSQLRVDPFSCPQFIHSFYFWKLKKPLPMRPWKNQSWFQTWFLWISKVPHKRLEKNNCKRLQNRIRIKTNKGIAIPQTDNNDINRLEKGSKQRR